MLLLVACVDAPSDSIALAESTEVPAQVETNGPPIGAVQIDACGDAGDCACSSAAMWGLYDRPPEPSVFGEEWEYWGPDPVWDGECAAISTDIVGICDPTCAGDEFCDWDGYCQRWPEHVDAGTLTVDGLAAPLHFEFSDVTGYGLMDVVPDEPFSGGIVTLRAAGGEDLPAFEVSTTPPEPLDTRFNYNQLLGMDEDLVLTWTPSGDDDLVRFSLSVIGHGGNGRSELLCESPDDGEMILPRGNVEVNGAESSVSVELTRFRRDLVRVGAGTVRLELFQSQRWGNVISGC